MLIGMLTAQAKVPKSLLRQWHYCIINKHIHHIVYLLVSISYMSGRAERIMLIFARIPVQDDSASSFQAWL